MYETLESLQFVKDQCERIAMEPADPATWALAECVRVLAVLLESQKSPETPGLIPHRHEDWRGFKSGLPILETPESESTSPASDGASPETTTPSTPETVTMAPTSSQSTRGWRSGDQGIHLTTLPPSRTTAPTSSSPSTEPSTGRSVGIDEAAVHNHDWTLKGVTYGYSDAWPYKATLYCRGCGAWFSIEAPQLSSSASAGGESEECVHPFSAIGMSSIMNGSVTMGSVFKCHDCGREQLSPGKGEDSISMARPEPLSPSPSSSQEEETR